MKTKHCIFLRLSEILFFTNIQASLGLHIDNHHTCLVRSKGSKSSHETNGQDNCDTKKLNNRKQNKNNGAEISTRCLQARVYSNSVCLSAAKTS